jgi:nucleotide-binding universal stress UspA family protein
MIPKINKILYATDLSANSAYAFRYAVNSAEHHDAQIAILHVLEELHGTARSIVDTYIDEDQREKLFEEKMVETKHRITERLRVFCEKELKDRPECIDRVQSIEVVEGYPAEVILKKADEFDCDIIIMGTHGKGIISHTFLGSVAERVLRRIRKPVFIIPLPKGESDITFHDI